MKPLSIRSSVEDGGTEDLPTDGLRFTAGLHTADHLTVVRRFAVRLRDTAQLFVMRKTTEGTSFLTEPIALVWLKEVPWISAIAIPEDVTRQVATTTSLLMTEC